MERRCEALGKKNAASLNANQDHVGAIFIALGDFVGDAGQGAAHRRGIQNDRGMGRFPFGTGLGIWIVFHALATSLDRI
jgi:hypothetical protein